MNLVVFDLDHTLLVGNSCFHFGIYLYRQSFFSFWTMLACLNDYMKHKWGRLSMQNLHIQSFNRLFKGRSLLEIEQHVDQFLNKHLNSMLYQPIIQRLKAAQRENQPVLILSSSPDFLVKKIAQRLDIQQWKSTAYQVDEGGEFITISDIMEGQNKADYIRILANQMHLPLSAVTVYSDSHLDLPILKIVGKAIGVVPDIHLKRICLQNGWEIL